VGWVSQAASDAHVEAGVRQARAQVVALAEWLIRVPGTALGSCGEEATQALAAELQALDRRFDARHLKTQVRGRSIGSGHGQISATSGTIEPQPRSQNVILIVCQAETVVGLPWAADSCPWVGKLRTVLPLSDGIRDSAVCPWG
jgi:hypothetical protein